MDGEDLLALQARYRENNKQRRKHSIRGVLQNVQKEKLFSTIINDFRKANTKLQFESRKLTLDSNYSTQLMRLRKTKPKKVYSLRNNRWLNQQTTPLENYLSEQKQPTQTYSVSKRSISSKRKNSSQFPSLLNFTVTKVPQINSKDKRIHSIFLKMAKSSEFIYNVSVSKKLFLEFITKQYSRKFANYLSWFFDLRANIDYKHYIEMGNKLLELTPNDITHFVYSAFDGFALESCFDFFKQNFGLKDVLFVTRMRDTLKTSDQPIIFDKMSYNSLKNVIKRDSQLTNCCPKMDTIYRNTFLRNDLQLNVTESTEKVKFNGRPRRKGQISYEEFCMLYSNKVPSFYADILFRLYCVQLPEGEVDQTFKKTYLQLIGNDINGGEISPQKNNPAAKILEQLQNAKKRQESLKLYKET